MKLGIKIDDNNISGNTIVSYLPLNHLFTMIACPSHILESNEGIEIKLGI